MMHLDSKFLNVKTGLQYEDQIVNEINDSMHQ